MGKSDVLRTVAQRIDDDFLFQTEDIVIAGLVQQASFRYGRVHDEFLHHQLMNRTSPLKKRIKYITQFQYEWDPEDEIRTYIMLAKGIIKYMPPENKINWDVITALEDKLSELKRRMVVSR